MSEAIAFTERFVVRAGTARAMARAFVVVRLSSTRQWILLGAFYVLFTFVILAGPDRDLGVGLRVFLALLTAIVPLAVLVGVDAVFTYASTLRNVSKRIFENAVLESGFGTDALATKGPLAEGRMTYRSISSVKCHGDFVFLREVGNPLTFCYPRELFPDGAIETIRAAMVVGSSS